jgi:hypothetical protein
MSASCRHIGFRSTAAWPTAGTCAGSFGGSNYDMYLAIAGPIPLLVRDGEYRVGGGRYELMFGEDNRAFPYPRLVSLLPLPKDDRPPTEVVLVKFDAMTHRHQIGSRQGGIDLFSIH